MASAATTSHSQQQANRRNAYTLNKSIMNETNASLYSNLSHRSKYRQLTQEQAIDENNNYLVNHNELQINHNSQQHNSCYLKQSNGPNSSEYIQKTNLMYRNPRSCGNIGDEMKFNLNHLVWAKLNNFPWWPCKIVNDSNNEYTKIIDNNQMYFIEFFGPLVERAWLSQSSIFRYKGIESFKIYAQDQVDRALSKSAKEKLAERFQLKVALNRRDQWEQAIEQADFYLKTLESIHDLNSVYSKTEKSKSANLADSLARLNQINEEKSLGKSSNYIGQSIKRKRDPYQMNRKISQDEFISNRELMLQKQYVNESNLHKLNDQQFKKPRKVKKNFDETQVSLDASQFHSIESIRNEKISSYNFNSNFANQGQTDSLQNRVQNFYNSKNLSRKSKFVSTDELQEENEAQNESDSQNSDNSSDEDNDSLFQPTSIFEYDIEQPHQSNSNRDEFLESQSINKGFQGLGTMENVDMSHSINSIVTEIKNNASKLNKNGYYHDMSEREYNIINSFITSDSEEEEKVDKNDTEWSNTSFKANKKKSSQKSISKRNTKFNQKLICSENKKLYESKQLQQKNANSPIKKKRGRKPKFATENNAFANDENKTFIQQQQDTLDSQEMYEKLKDSNSKMYQKICSNSISISSNNSSRRASDTSTLSAATDDELFESKPTNLVLIEDSSVLNQSEIGKLCKKKFNLKPTAVKKSAQPKKRNSKSSNSSIGSLTGMNDFSTLEQINQMTDSDYNQFVDENRNNIGIQYHEASSVAAAAEQSPVNTTNTSTAETYLIDRYKYAVRHIRQGLSVEEACNKYRISKGALLKCLSGGTAPRGKKTRLTESEENEIVEWLINNKDLKYNEAIHLVFEQVEKIFELAQRPNPFNNGKPSMDWWYDFLSRHPQIMASKPDWLMRGKVNDQYIKDVQSGQLKCTKFRRALLSAIQYIRSLNDAQTLASSTNYRNLSNKLPVNNSQSFKVAPGLTNRIEKNDDHLAKSNGLRQSKPLQKSTHYKNSILKQRKISTQGLSQEVIEKTKEIKVEEVPSPTSLDTRIFNNENSINDESNNTNSEQTDFPYINHQKSIESSRPIRNEKSIQDSLEYLYEQNNNFINEISNINQLMDKNNSTSQVNDQNTDTKSQFYDESSNKQSVVDSFDKFLDQALSKNNFEDLIDSKMVDNSALSLGVGGSNLSTSSSSNQNGNGSTSSSIVDDFVAGGNESNYVSQPFNGRNVTNDESYFQSNFNQSNYFNNIQNSMYKSNQNNSEVKKQQSDLKQNDLDSSLFLNNLNEDNVLLNSSCDGFNNFSQSQTFNTKFDFTQKNHLLVQDDDDENEEDIELVSSILSNTDDNYEDNDNGLIVNSIDPSGFLP